MYDDELKVLHDILDLQAKWLRNHSDWLAQLETRVAGLEARECAVLNEDASPKGVERDWEHPTLDNAYGPEEG
jgi:hypothetical protein